MTLRSSLLPELLSSSSTEEVADQITFEHSLEHNINTDFLSITFSGINPGEFFISQLKNIVLMKMELVSIIVSTMQL